MKNTGLEVTAFRLHGQGNFVISYNLIFNYIRSKEIAAKEARYI
jgi:hypothetical protein